ncbi:MAG: H-NS family nucleoid-associated regulatory protein [Janthinobacterium lividum]
MSKQMELERLMQEKAKLDSQIETMRAAEKSTALAEVLEKIAAFELTPAELGFNSPRAYARKHALGNQRSAVAPKYRDPESGKTWSGRGKPPLWIAGKDRDGFAIG